MAEAKYLIILSCIGIYWFITSLLFTMVSNDVVLATSQAQSFNTTITNTSETYLNISADNPTSSAKSFFTITGSMFIMRLPKTLFPVFLQSIIAFINWLLVLILIVCLYRLGNPIS